MELMFLGLVLFFACHSLNIYAPGARAKLVEQLGALPFKALYALISLVGLGCIFTGHPQAFAQMDWGWSPPTFTKHLNALLMLVACIILVSSCIPKNHIKARLKHPMILSVKIWAFGHLLANGEGANIVLFASFLIWSVLSFKAARKTDKTAALHSQTEPSTLNDSPDAPSDHQRAKLLSTAVCVFAGAGIWVMMIGWLHFKWFGVYPIIIPGLIGPN
jgi:uncharacterized membrane protein